MVYAIGDAKQVKSLKHINIYVKIGDPTWLIFTYCAGSWNTSNAINEGSLYNNFIANQLNEFMISYHYHSHLKQMYHRNS